MKRLVRKGVKVLVQPSNRRAYPMQVLKNLKHSTFKKIPNKNVIISKKCYGYATHKEVNISLVASSHWRLINKNSFQLLWPLKRV